MLMPLHNEESFAKEVIQFDCVGSILTHCGCDEVDHFRADVASHIAAIVVEEVIDIKEIFATVHVELNVGIFIPVVCVLQEFEQGTFNGAVISGCQDEESFRLEE